MSPPSPPPPKSSGSLHGNEEPASERRTLRDYIIILRERLWIALPVALLVAVGVGYYQAQQTPLYSATATMLFEHPERVVLNEQVVDPSVRSEIDLNNYITDLRSNRLHALVAQALKPDEVQALQRPYLKGAPAGTVPPPPGALFGIPDVGNVRNSSILTISVSNRDPDGAAIIANKYVEVFMEFLIQGVGGKNEFAVEYLKNRAEELRVESEKSEQKLQQYKRDHNLVSLSASVDIVADRLKTINGALTSVRLERLNLDVLLKQIEKFQADHGNLLEISYIANYGNVPALKAQLADLTKQQSIDSERYLERHPKMIDLANSIDVVNQQIAKNVDQAIADLRAQFAKVTSSEQSYEREYREAEKAQLSLGDLSVEFKSLENQASVAKSNYIQILDRLNQTTTSKNLENIPLKLIDKAVRPGGPYTPNIGNIVKTCVGLGVVVFCGIAIGMSFLDDRVKSAWDVESFIGAHLLGIVPDLSGVPDAEKATLVTTNQTTPGSEAFLSIYSSIKIQSKLDFPKSILVTSTIPGEGKTMISSNIANSFACHGKKVLLIDCDLRRPMLHRSFNLGNDAGLIAWYEAGAKVPADPLAEASLGIVRVAENLFLLRSGGRSKTPTELLENPVFGQFLDAMKRHFDLVVVDSPPMGAVTDSLLIAERIDEIIYVCRFNRAYRKHIRLYIKGLTASKGELLGVVLNGLSPRRIQYYSNYRYYRSYKKYYGAQS
ncbi:MAG TPA: polysaccharide biosynthesis tyrosine autokinase [Candidatus Didemnitutus sp.]|nr:polysaccharide biosynthesis tyrosine autokinase [Candidatus Didemnitutus sp.]